MVVSRAQRRWSGQCSMCCHSGPGGCPWRWNTRRIRCDNSILTKNIQCIPITQYMSIRSLFYLTTVNRRFLSTLLSYYGIPIIRPPIREAYYRRKRTNDNCLTKSGPYIINWNISLQETEHLHHCNFRTGDAVCTVRVNLTVFISPSQVQLSSCLHIYVSRWTVFISA